MKDTRAPSKMKLMGGGELTEAVGADFGSMVACVRELLAWPFVPIAKLAGLKLTPGQKEQLEGLIRGAIRAWNTGEKIAERMAGMAERDARGQGRAPLSLVMGESLRLGVGAAYAVSLCYQALRLYEEVTGKAMPEASDLIAKMDTMQATLDTIQTHTAGVPAMVERERVDSAREQHRVMAQIQRMELTQREMRLLQLWCDHESMAAIARTMNISRRTAYNIKYAIEAKYAANTEKHHPLPSPFVKQPSVREDEEQRMEDMTGQQVKRNQRRK